MSDTIATILIIGMFLLAIASAAYGLRRDRLRRERNLERLEHFLGRSDQH